MISSVTLTWLVANILPLVLTAIGNYFLKEQQQRSADQAKEQAGVERQASVTNKGTADAIARASEAQINAPDIDSLRDDLWRGWF